MSQPPAAADLPETCALAASAQAVDGAGASVSAAREALRAELAEMFGSRTQFRELLRQEVLRAIEGWCGRALPERATAEVQQSDIAQAATSYCLTASRPARPKNYAKQPMPENVDEVASYPRDEVASYMRDDTCDQVQTSQQGSPLADNVATGNSSNRPKAEHRLNSENLGSHCSNSSALSSQGVVCQHFNTFAMCSQGSEESMEPNPSIINRTSMLSTLSSRLPSVLEQDQPAQKGLLSRVVGSQAFESGMRVAILANCVFMVYLANKDIKEWDRPTHVAITVGELVFLMIYLCEMIAKLLVFRLFYFFEKQNCFDCLLVLIDVWDLVTKYLEHDALSASYLRIFRLLKLGKALRAVQVVRAFEKLKAFLICINGSLSSLAWSLVMLSIILYMFSLCIVQIIAFYFRDSQDVLDDEGRMAFETAFGSVQLSMLTLFQLSTDGSGWKQSYDLISQTGWIGSVVFLAYVSFTHIAVINIITGIFVESAMQNLAPNRDSLALDHHFREQQAARELEQLFRCSSGVSNGTVCKEEFDSLVKAGRLPRLLSLLGLREQHARDFFNFLSSASPDGEVPITGFVRGCMKLKGSATSFDLHMLQVEVQTISRTVKELRRRTRISGTRFDTSMPMSQTSLQGYHM